MSKTIELLVRPKGANGDGYEYKNLSAEDVVTKFIRHDDLQKVFGDRVALVEIKIRFIDEIALKGIKS